MELAVIILFCVFGCGATSFLLGRRLGISATLDYLHTEGYIDLDYGDKDDFED